MISMVTTVKELNINLKDFLYNNIKKDDDVVITIFLGKNKFTSTKNESGVIDSNGPYTYYMDEFLELRIKEVLKSNKVKLIKEMRYIEKSNPTSFFDTKLYFKEADIRASVIELDLNDVKRFINSGIFYLIHVNNSTFRLKNL